MSTEAYNILNLVLQALVWATMLGTLWVYHGQLETYRRQLQAMISGSVGQNTMNLINFLQAESVREARTIVRNNLRGKAYRDWTPEEKRAADVVCSTYDVAAILILEQKLVPADVIIENWERSIQDCFTILQPHLQERRKEENSGAAYWDGFNRLAEMAQSTRTRRSV